VRRLLFVLTAMSIAAASLVVVPRLTGSTEAAADTHCVVQVLGVQDSGEFILTEPTCVTGGDQARADLYLAVGASGESINVTLANSGSDVRVTELAAAVQVLGVHFDAVGFGGSSFAVVGNNCNGGYLNLSSSWINKVSSTDNVTCTRIKHHDNYNTSGTYQSTWGSGGSLSYMQNRANSISYTTS